jgi:hypothetical protein
VTRKKRDRSIRDSRDLELAAFVDGYAEAVANGMSWGPNRLKHPAEIRGLLATTLRGLASTIRAGLVDSEIGESLEGGE